MKSHFVKVWAIRPYDVGGKDKPKKAYSVRWSVRGREKSRAFATRALAERFRSKLMEAQSRGEEFDMDSGLPDSMVERPPAVTWLAFVEKYLDMKWPGAAAKTRQALIDALLTVTPLLVRDDAGRPDLDVLRTALREYVLPPTCRHLDRPPAVVSAARWLASSSLPLTDLAQPATVRSALDALTLKLDGKPAAATTSRRRRSVFYNVLQYAAELEVLPINPVEKLRVRSRRKAVTESVDRRVVANPRQAQELLIATSYVGERGTVRRGERLVAFFACMYLAAMRPGEVLGLRDQDCQLPARCASCGVDLTDGRPVDAGCPHEVELYGWGRLVLQRSRPESGKRWTDSGEVHDDRGLKHRAETETRSVPAPPPLVGYLRAHIRRFGVADDGRLFRSTHGRPVGASSYNRVWDQARRLALTPRQVDSPLAGRPYDLRHGAVSLWLNSGVPATEVAERAGQSVEVLFAVYAKCIDGDEAVINDRIERALGDLRWSRS